MEPTAMLNLHWNSFESNTRATLKTMREEREFCDVTLACDGNQVQAHKVILAGGSPFFKKILREYPHPHPLIYLKGVKFHHLLVILDFIYKGEASIVEEELDTFLEASKELKIKGLVENKASKKTSNGQTKLLPKTTSQDNEKYGPMTKVTKVRRPQNVDNASFSKSTFKKDQLNVPLASEAQDYVNTSSDYAEEANDYQRDCEAKEDVNLKTEIPEDVVILDDFDITGVITSEHDRTARKTTEPEVDCFDKEITSMQDMSERSGEEMSRYWNEDVVMEQDGEQDQVDESKKLKHVCSVCGTSCRQPNDLKIHMRIHTGEKPYQCICSKKFAHKGNFNRHKKLCQF